MIGGSPSRRLTASIRPTVPVIMLSPQGAPKVMGRVIPGQSPPGAGGQDQLDRVVSQRLCGVCPVAALIQNPPVGELAVGQVLSSRSSRAAEMSVV
jgi:hypothetical protein